MTTWKITATALAIVMGFAAAADARGGMGERPDFATLDVDGSGEITTTDLEALRANRFADIDADGDGSVTLEEFKAHAAAQSEERAERMFSRLDADGDGALSRDVLENTGRRGGGERMGRMIECFDTDNSGGISAEEFEAAQERMAERGGRKGKKNR